MKKLLAPIAIVAALSFAGTAYAQCCAKAKAAADKKMANAETKKNCEKTCDKTAKKECCTKDKSCTKDKAQMAAHCRGKALVATHSPLMSYKVGDKCTRCPEQAKEMAAKHEGVQVRYAVNDDVYTDKQAAMKAWKKALHEHLNHMLAVRYAVGDECVACPHAAEAMAKKDHQKVRFQVAAHNYDAKEEAEQALHRAREAADSVKLTHLVNGKEYKCDKSAKNACDKAKSCDKADKICHQYVVGDFKTCCPLTAKVELAKARIQAAYEALSSDTDKELAQR